jgi:hypothetical protein
MFLVGSVFAGLATAEDDTDPVLFIIGDGATYSGGTGWYAGYVIVDDSGTYTLQISATGPQSRFPVSNTKIVVCISDEAVSTATVVIGSNTASPYTVTGYTNTNPSYYPPGGVFSEPDYYGYNDAYTISTLTYAQSHHPESYYPLQVTVTFSPSATQASKVMFLCYGIDSKGDDAKTPFSGGTLFTPLPEYDWALAAFAVSFAALGVYKLKNKKN